MSRFRDRLAQSPWHGCLGLTMLAALTGCAAAPSRQLTRWGTIPGSVSGTYALSPVSSAVDAALVADVQRCLNEAGLKPGAKPRLLVEIAFAQAPAGVGVTGANHAEPQPTLTTGSLSRRAEDRDALTVIITDMADGHDLFRASLIQRKPPAKTSGQPEMAQALCQFARADQTSTG